MTSAANSSVLSLSRAAHFVSVARLFSNSRVECDASVDADDDVPGQVKLIGRQQQRELSDAARGRGNGVALALQIHASRRGCIVITPLRRW